MFPSASLTPSPNAIIPWRKLSLPPLPTFINLSRRGSKAARTCADLGIQMANVPGGVPIPYDVFQLIFKWISPLHCLKYRRLCTFANECLTDPYFASLNLLDCVENMRLHPECQRSRLNEVSIHWPTALDRVWMRWPEAFQGVYFELALLGMKAWSLSNSNCGGTISPLVGRLDTLFYLNLDNCGLSGFIPNFSGLTSLRHLNLGNNQLSGPLPHTLGQNITRLFVHNNRLTGNIPQEWGGSLVNCVHISLSNNRLTGTIPIELAALTSLFQFNLIGNRFERAYPREIASRNERLKDILKAQRFYPR